MAFLASFCRTENFNVIGYFEFKKYFLEYSFQHTLLKIQWLAANLVQFANQLLAYNDIKHKHKYWIGAAGLSYVKNKSLSYSYQSVNELCVCVYISLKQSKCMRARMCVCVFPNLDLFQG